MLSHSHSTSVPDKATLSGDANTGKVIRAYTSGIRDFLERDPPRRMRIKCTVDPLVMLKDTVFSVTVGLEDSLPCPEPLTWASRWLRVLQLRRTTFLI